MRSILSLGAFWIHSASSEPQTPLPGLFPYAPHFPPSDHHQDCCDLLQTAEAVGGQLCMKNGTDIRAEVWEQELSWIYRKESKKAFLWPSLDFHFCARLPASGLSGKSQTLWVRSISWKVHLCPADGSPASDCPRTQHRSASPSAEVQVRFLLVKSWHQNIIWALDKFWHDSRNVNIAMKVIGKPKCSNPT